MNGTAFQKTSTLVWLTVALAATGGIVQADFTFGPAQNLGLVINSSSSDFGTSTSVDGLELYFSSERPGGSGGADLWVSTRQSTTEPWRAPANLGPTVNSPYGDCYPSLSADGLTLYFSGDYSSTPRPGGLGRADIWMTTRVSRSAPWGPPVNPGASVNSSERDFSPTISGDGLTLVFTSTRSGGFGSWDLWVATRARVEDAWNLAVNAGANVNSGSVEGECALSADGRALFFLSNRSGGMGSWDLWMSTRSSAGDAWGLPANLGPAVNSASGEGSAGIAADMKTLYFTSDRSGGLGSYDLCGAPILPIVDFDGNGTVNTGDLLRLIESWGQDDPLCDIGPGPWGDGTVDAADLEVLMSYWDQEVNDPTLVAHWPLDETEGMVAHDPAGGKDGLLMGLPQWGPRAGMVAGALELNGMTFVTAATPLSPADGPFSVLAWVKGGGPGQTLLAQQGTANWLMTDAAGGLATELSPGGRTTAPLASGAVITDGNWHRVAFTWDGTSRRLYVDDALAAADVQQNLAAATGKLVLGAAKNMAPGSFWTGLLDDVRIYNRAVQPASK
jgi:hypothetical protein